MNIQNLRFMKQTEHRAHARTCMPKTWEAPEQTKQWARPSMTMPCSLSMWPQNIRFYESNRTQSQWEYEYGQNDNEIQFLHLKDLYESFELKGPPSSYPYRTVSKSNDMQFHHLNDSYESKGPPSSQINWTVSLNNDMQFHHLNDSYDSYELKGPPFLTALPDCKSP